MATRDQLKKEFKSGECPSQEDYYAIFDSTVGYDEDGVTKPSGNNPLKIQGRSTEENILRFIPQNLSRKEWLIQLNKGNKPGLSISNENGPCLFLKEDGKVGIGTEEPNNLLTLRAQIPIIELYGGKLPTGESGESIGQIRWYGTTSDENDEEEMARIQVVHDDVTDASDNASFHFYQRINNQFKEVLTIDSEGTVHSQKMVIGENNNSLNGELEVFGMIKGPLTLPLRQQKVSSIVIWGVPGDTIPLTIPIFDNEEEITHQALRKIFINDIKFFGEQRNATRKYRIKTVFYCSQRSINIGSWIVFSFKPFFENSLFEIHIDTPMGSSIADEYHSNSIFFNLDISGYDREIWEFMIHAIDENKNNDPPEFELKLKYAEIEAWDFFY